jgi:hypothetical protein
MAVVGLLVTLGFSLIRVGIIIEAAVPAEQCC